MPVAARGGCITVWLSLSLSGHVAEWEGGRAGECKVCKCGINLPGLGRLCSRVGLRNEHGGKQCCGLSSLSLTRPTRGGTDKYTSIFCRSVKYMDVWLLPGSGVSGQQARWEVGDDICVVLILPRSPARPSSSRSPQASFVNYVHEPAKWVCRVAVPEHQLGP